MATKTTAKPKATLKKVETAVKETATATKEAVKDTVKAAEKKVEKTVKAAEKTVKTAAKKAPAKKEAAKKTELKVSQHVQFSGKSYSTDDLVKIAKDVWKYDMKKKVDDIKSINLYVKPEESQVYFVVNDKEAGSFVI